MTVAEKIDAKLVKDLREKSGAPMGDCLKALQETKGNIEEAFVVLRKRGMASAQKKAARTTNEGAVGTYIHAGNMFGRNHRLASDVVGDFGKIPAVKLCLFLRITHTLRNGRTLRKSEMQGDAGQPRTQLVDVHPFFIGHARLLRRHHADQEDALVQRVHEQS